LFHDNGLNYVAFLFSMLWFLIFLIFKRLGIPANETKSSNTIKIRLYAMHMHDKRCFSSFEEHVTH